MKTRLIALLAVWCLLCVSTACRVRVDLSDSKLDGEATGITTTTTAPSPASNDEMAAQAWEIYSRALDLEAEYTTYDLVYKARMMVGRDLKSTNARIVRIEKDGEVALLVEKEAENTFSSGYLKDGIGYFFIDGKKYWIPVDEDAFFDTMGFSPTEPLIEEMFANALVVWDDDGEVTVSCPLAAQYAADYARMYLGGGVVQSGTISRAEVGVAVNAEGYPQVFTSDIELYGAGIGAISLQCENCYTAVGDEVTLIPPADLDTYSSIIE